MKLSLVLFVMSLFQLKSQNDSNIQQNQASLHGTWNWFLTHEDYIGMNGIRKLTPDQCNCTKTIVFKNGNILEYYSNDSLISTDNYSIDEIINQHEERIILSSKIYSGYMKFRSDTLGIGWFGSCATLNYFIKDKNKLN
jgi:hypothetical protein